MSAALVDNAVTSCKAEPTSLPIGFGGEKWLEEMRFCFVVHSDPGVGDVNQNIFARNKVAALERRFRFLRKIDNRSFERELAACRHRVARIHCQIENDLRNLAWVGLDVRPFFLVVEMANDGNILADEPEQ